MFNTAVAISILLYLIAIGYLYLFQRSILFVNRFKVKPKSGFYIDNTWIETRDLNRSNAIIYFGGNAQNNWVDIDLLKKEFPNSAILFMHYRGYGASKDKPSQDAIFSDSLKLYYKIKDRYKTITTIGRSLGSGVAIYLASKRGVDNLIAITPYDSIANIAKLRYPIFPIDLLIKDRFDSFKYAQKVNVKPLIILAEDDNIVPHSSSKNLIKYFKTEPKVVTIDNTNHLDIINNQRMYQVIREFIISIGENKHKAFGKV